MEKTIYFGGPILTMDRTCKRVEAILVAAGKIAARGTLAEMEALAPDAKREDLKGKTLMPGFVDGHSHMGMMGLSLRECDLTQCRSFDDILDAISDFRIKRGLTHGEIIRCSGYDDKKLKEQAHPNAALLDKLNIDNPIGMNHYSIHMAVYNTAAMKLCGVDDSFVCPEDGVVGRDENGHLTGYFEERARYALTPVMEKIPLPEFEEAILEAQDYYISKGFTTIQDGTPTRAGRLSCFERLADAGKLKADVVAFMNGEANPPTFWDDVISRRGNREYRNHLKIGGIKLVLDGSLQVKTGWLLEPYEGESEYRGYPLFAEEKVEEIIRRAVEKNIQPIMHCNGDAACEQFVSLWEKVTAKLGYGNDLRPVMIHAQTVTDDQMARMVKSGMMASFFIGHCQLAGDTHIINLGKRAFRLDPMASALKLGLPVSIHQDSPVTKPDMLHSVWCAVDRLTPKGVLLGGEERVDVYDALIAATHGGAYSYFEEETKGMLKAGMVADLVVLDRDPTAVPSVEIKDIQVLRTIKEGKTLFAAVNA